MYPSESPRGQNPHLRGVCEVCESRSVMSDSLWPHGLHSPWNSPGQKTGVGSLSLLQGIFPTQGSNPGLLHCRWILYHLSHQRSPRILEWVAYPFPKGSSQPSDQTGVSCIAGEFFTSWATRKAQAQMKYSKFFVIEWMMCSENLSLKGLYRKGCTWKVLFHVYGREHFYDEYVLT